LLFRGLLFALLGLLLRSSLIAYHFRSVFHRFYCLLGMLLSPRQHRVAERVVVSSVGKMSEPLGLRIMPYSLRPQTRFDLLMCHHHSLAVHISTAETDLLT
jgi:hypothetical protein